MENWSSSEHCATFNHVQHSKQRVMQVVRKNVSVFTSVWSEKVKMLEKVNVNADLW
jgi:hypothetical protein